MRSQRDVEKMAKRVEVAKDRIAAWPSDQLMVYAEHPSLFYDLMTDQLLEQVRSNAAFREGQGHRFIWCRCERMQNGIIAY